MATTTNTCANREKVMEQRACWGWVGEAALCFVGGSHEGRVRKCYGNVIGFEDFGYMEM